MAKVYILCYRYVNELEDIRVCTSLDKALDELSKRTKSHQILEYDVIDEISHSRPVFAYFYDSDKLVRQHIKTER